VGAVLLLARRGVREILWREKIIPSLYQASLRSQASRFQDTLRIGGHVLTIVSVFSGSPSL
jgi:hypothetical protein